MKHNTKDKDGYLIQNTVSPIALDMLRYLDVLEMDSILFEIRKKVTLESEALAIDEIVEILNNIKPAKE